MLFHCIENPDYDDYKQHDFKTIGCGVSSAFLFFFFYLLLVKLMFLNLFIAIILMGYDENKKDQEKPINNEIAELFRDVWSEFDPKGTGLILV